MVDSLDTPEFLYHSSCISGLRVLEPRSVHRGLRPDGTRILIATPSLAYASCFLFRWHDFLARCGTWDQGETWVFRIIEPDAIQYTGGSIYKVSSEGFTYNPDYGMGKFEWMKTTPALVLGEERWDSGLEAMQHYGVQIRWPLDQPLAIEILREQLQMEGFEVSSRNVFMDGLHSALDLVVLRNGAQADYGLVYDSGDVVAALEVEGVGLFGKRRSKMIQATFDKVKAVNQGISCAYVVLLQEEVADHKVSEEVFGYPTFRIYWSRSDDGKMTLRPRDEWSRFLHDLTSKVF